MALNAYLKLKGKKQGLIKGSVTQKGREDKIMVISVSHEIKSPTDTASGLPTGKVQHTPLTITKEVDKSSPLLYNALVNNENLSEFNLQFWRPLPNGTERQFYTISLVNARICDIRLSMLNNKNPDLMRYPELEEVSFVYQKIEWTWTDGNITSSDLYEHVNI